MSAGRATPTGLIRTARPADAAGVARVHAEVFAETYPGLLPQALIDEASGPERAARWGALAVDPGDCRLIVAEVAGAVAGFTYVGPALDPRLEAEAEVRSLNVLRAHRGLGLGRSLLVEAAREALARGAPSLALWAVRDNLPAEAFYARMGAEWGIERTDWECGHAIPERAHRWPETSELVERNAQRG